MSALTKCHIQNGMDWWRNHATPEQKEKAFETLLRECVMAETVRTWSNEQAEQLSEESEDPVHHWLIPYLESCGEPICDPVTAGK